LNCSRPLFWAERSDDVLLDQGHESAAIGHGLATRLVPSLPDRLAQAG
jgi:hypothetical protein